MMMPLDSRQRQQCVCVRLYSAIAQRASECQACGGRRSQRAEYSKAGREDLVVKEQAELDVLHEFLPAALSEEELRAIVVDVISETGASGPKSVGKVMGPAMKRTAQGGQNRLETSAHFSPGAC